MREAVNARKAIEIDGVFLEYAGWHGSGDERLPILLMHEGLGSVSLWREFPKLLAQSTGREVIAWSRQGHGWSDPIKIARRPDYMHIEARLLPDLYKQFGIDRAHWLGHSDGGSIALIGAAWYPDLVSSMILEAPHVFVEEVTVSSIAKIGQHYNMSDMRTRMRRHHVDPDHIFRMWNNIWLEPEFQDWNIEGLLAGVTVPALLIQGKDDEYGSFEQLDRIEKLLGSTFRLELDACGHSPHRDRLDAVLESVTEFLKERE